VSRASRPVARIVAPEPEIEQALRDLRSGQFIKADAT